MKPPLFGNSPAFAALEAAYKENPEAFKMFVAGIFMAGQTGSAEPANLLPPAKSATLAEIVSIYKQVSPVSKKAVYGNLWSLKRIIRTVFQTEDMESITLDRLDGHTCSLFQESMIKEYCANAPKDEASQKVATDKACRTSRSTLRQARSIFCRNGNTDMIERYQRGGLHIPGNIEQFVKARLRGRSWKPDYIIPPDVVIENTIKDVERFREDDPDVYKAFALALYGGLRRGEIAFARWEQIVVREGRWWLCGGIGKDGEFINQPLMLGAITALESFRKQEGYIIEHRPSRCDAVFRRLNLWMSARGWNTEKKLHEVRKLAGSRIYNQNPVACMRFLRHKTIQVSEQYYVKYSTQFAGPAIDVFQ